MASRIVIDPITRIEGHLRIEIAVQDGVVTDAFSSGTMVRGFELILKGRDPRDARPSWSAPAASADRPYARLGARRGNSLGITVPPNITSSQPDVLRAVRRSLPSPRALDWVDIVSALKADPKKTSELAQSLSSWPKSSPGYFSDVQKRIKTFVESGQLGIFANGYWGHSAFKLPAEANLMGVAHYLEALEWQKEIVKVHAIFGGKNPHPNYLVGGVPCSLNIDEANSINAERLAHVAKLFDDAQQFVEQVYIPDLLAIASFYKDWGAIGGGLSNYMAYGDLPVNGYGDVRASSSRAASSSTATWPRCCRWTAKTRCRCRSSSTTPGTTTRPAMARACIRGTARPSCTTPDRSRRMRSSTSRRSNRG
jgi:hydrogenase large subunit